VPPDASHGPLVVYVSRLPGKLPGGVTYEVVAFDTRSGQRWASFQCGLGCGEARLAPDGSIYFQDEAGIERRKFTEDAPVKVFAPPAGRQLSGFAVSRAGKLLAVALEGDTATTSFDGELVILDLGQTGADGSPVEVRRVNRDDPRLVQPFSGWLSSPEWLADDAGVTVVGASGKDGFGGQATLFLDGAIRVNARIGRQLSPDGRYVFESGSPPCPYAFYTDETTIRDAASDEILGRYDAPAEQTVNAVKWAPDSSALLIAVWHLTPTICQDTNPPPQPEYWLLPVHGAPARPVADVEGLRRQWYGSNVVELTCDTYLGTRIAPSAGGQLGCRDGNPARLLIAGKDAGTAVEVHTLGVIP
jgi:hypothetical protein